MAAFDVGDFVCAQARDDGRSFDEAVRFAGAGDAGLAEVIGAPGEKLAFLVHGKAIVCTSGYVSYA